jgi:hypothetical protein
LRRILVVQDAAIEPPCMGALRFARQMQKGDPQPHVSILVIRASACGTDPAATLRIM